MTTRYLLPLGMLKNRCGISESLKIFWRRTKGMETIKVDKFGSATSRLRLPSELEISADAHVPTEGDVVIVKALSESVTYGNLELPSGWLAKINRNDVLTGVCVYRRALHGLVRDIPTSC